MRLSLRFLHALSQWSCSYPQECGYWSKWECWLDEWNFPGLDVIKNLSWTERKKLPYNFLSALTKSTLISASIDMYEKWHLSSKQGSDVSYNASSSRMCVKTESRKTFFCSRNKPFFPPLLWNKLLFFHPPPPMYIKSKIFFSLSCRS